MSIFARILPFLWPSRRKLFLSFGFAALVAVLWGGNLSIVFPVVKVLMERKSLEGYLAEQIEINQREIEVFQASIRGFEAELKSATPKKTVHILEDKAHDEAKVTSLSQRQVWLRRAMVYVIPHVPNDQFDTLALILGLLILMTSVKLLCMLAEDLLVGSVVQLTLMRIRKQCFRKVIELDYQTLIRRGTPELMSRFTYDLETLGNGLSLLGGKVIREPLKACACIGFAFWVNWRLTLLSLVFVPLAFLVFHRFGKMLKKASHRSMESMSRIYKVLEETFEAMKVVIAFNGGRRHRLKHHRESRTYYDKSMKIVLIDALTSPVTELLGMVAVALAVLPGAYLVLRETTSIWGIKLAAAPMDIAELSVLYALLAGVLDPVRKLSSVFSKLKRSSAAADRIFDLMDCESLVRDTTEPKPFPASPQVIEFQKIGFAYAAQEHARPAVLNEVSLKVRSGEVVAVVGENGSGKSTLVNLLPRFFDPDFGAVLVDGTDLRDFRLKDLRSRVGIVTQETLLFDDTIYENIRYGSPHATREQIERAARQAHVSQFLDQLPGGFETRVGEKGSCLSGGQRQRIALARAILRDPRFLILDEATSAIDAQSETLIHQTLREFVRGRTTFIITHSMTPSILDLVTRIVVLERGQIAANGSHDELLKSSAIYQRLYQGMSSRRAAVPAGGIAASDSASSPSDATASTGNAPEERPARSHSNAA